MAIQIVADSTCDLSPSLQAQYRVSILPLYVTLDGQSNRDGIDITAVDIFQHVDAGGALPKTAAVTVAAYLECFSKIREKGDSIVCVCIGSHFSSCYQNACIAASGFENVAVVDSANLSSGFGHVVIQAAILAQSGKPVAEIADTLREDIVPFVDASFIVDRLDYLHKGGRCSTVAALGANMLKLKPCIEVRNGEMVVSKKYRGNFQACVTQYVEDRLSNPDSICRERIFITHSKADASAVDAAQAAIQNCMHFDEILETDAGCTVSSHCGPNTLGVLFIRKK